LVAAHYHAVVWIDHHEAHIIFFNADDADETTVRPTHVPRHLHHTSGSPAGTHERGDAAYFSHVTDIVGEAKEFLVAGPSTAKTEFVTWLRRHAGPTAERLSGVETLPKLSDRQLVAEARRFFKAADRTTPQVP
jgi:hypothetical protein